MKFLLLLILTINLNYIYSQPRVINFDSQQNEAEQEYESNSLKIHILEFISNDYALYYEKALLNKLSAEVGIGVTYRDNHGDFYSDAFFSPSITDYKMAPSFFAGLRFYPYEVFEEFYVALEYKYRQYKWDRQVEDFSNSLQGVQTEVTESRVVSLPRVTLGYVIYLFSELTVDFHIGIGINSPIENYYNTQTFALEKHKLNSRPRLNGGVKIGYVF